MPTYAEHSFSSTDLASVSTYELPLDLILSDKTKEKVHNGEFIELSQLLFPTKDKQMIQKNSSNNISTFEVLPSATKKFFTLDQWMNAMHNIAQSS